jgi:membrane-bound lytic murein transglycosylase D
MKPPRPLPLRVPFAALVLVLASLVAGDAASQSASHPLFPRPAELEPDVQFWLKVYSEVGTDGGLVHDSRHLGIIYETVKFPKSASRRTRERLVERTKKRYRDALRSLGRGKRSGLSREQARILALWGGSPSNETLRAAAGRLRFQLGQADKFRAGLIRSGAWRDHIRKTFADMGLPTELAALPHVESSFTPHAWSRVGAAGLWQFTRSTGRRYMRVDHVVDERMDPIKATVAAARLLEHNHRATGTWPLALTSYNHGAAGMRRASRKMGTTDIVVINRKYRSRTFGFASRNFYPEFLAALEIDQNPEKFFGPLPTDTPPDEEVLQLPFYASARSVSEALGIDTRTLAQSNPALRDSVWSGSKRIPKGYELRVPRDRLARPLTAAIASIPEAHRHAKQTRDTFHKIQRGETLSSIAARYHTSITELQHLNGLRSKHRIRAGQRLRLPEEAGGSGRATRIARRSEPEPLPESGSYRVRRGDSLALIARRFGVSERDLLEWNPIRNKHRIAVGQRLRVQAPEAPGKPLVVAANTLPSEAPETTTDVAPPALPGAAADLSSANPLPVHPEPSASFTPPPSDDAAFDPSAITPDPTSDAGSVADAAAAELAQDGTPGADALLADPADYSIAPDGTIEVQAAETLGHYAEWLDVRASRLRQINDMRYGTPLSLGDRLRLDLGRVSKQTFEERRLEHHRALQGEFFERFEIDGTRVHRVRRGDSIWQIAERKYGVPVWLVRQYNPDVDFTDLHAGEKITIPHLKPRS